MEDRDFVKSKYDRMIYLSEPDQRTEIWTFTLTPEYGNLKLKYNFKKDQWNLTAAFAVNKRSKKNVHLTDEQRDEVKRMTWALGKQIYQAKRNAEDVVSLSMF